MKILFGFGKLDEISHFAAVPPFDGLGIEESRLIQTPAPPAGMLWVPRSTIEEVFLEYRCINSSSSVWRSRFKEDRNTVQSNQNHLRFDRPIARVCRGRCCGRGEGVAAFPLIVVLGFPSQMKACAANSPPNSSMSPVKAVDAGTEGDVFVDRFRERIRTAETPYRIDASPSNGIHLAA